MITQLYQLPIYLEVCAEMSCDVIHVDVIHVDVMHNDAM